MARERSGAHPAPGPDPQWAPPAPGPVTTREKVADLLNQLEAMEAALSIGLPPPSGPARITAARYAAARALLLQVIDEQEGQASPAQAKPMGPSLLAEQAHLSALVRVHGWRWQGAGRLVRGGGADHA